MSGAEAIAVLGVISSVIAIAQGTKQVYDAAKDASGLPEAFRVVAGQLPIVLDILDLTQKSVNQGNINEESCKAVKGVVEECKRKVIELDKIFREICPKDVASRLERYSKAVKTLGRGHKVDNLMQGILRDIQLLACERGIMIADKPRIVQVSTAIAELEALPSSDPQQMLQGTENTTFHSSSGTQYNAHGEFIAQSPARQYNSSGGTMNFGEVNHYYHSSSHSRPEPSKEDCTKCLAALFLTKPKDDREWLLHIKGSRADKTCVWIKENASYKSWLCSDSRLLWLSGGPGKGKTMLSIFLSEELERLASKSHSTIFLEYYCENKDDRRNSATTILRGLLYQLLQSRPNLFKYIIPDFQIQREELFARSSFLSLWKIFRDMLQDPDLRTVYCVLDGLDECDRDSLEMLLNKLKSLFLTELGLNTACHLKMILVSRDLPGFLSEMLSSFPRITLDLDANAEISHDIQLFIEDKTNELSKLGRYPNQLCAYVKDVFEKRAQGTFLWIGIVAQELRGCIATEVEETLKSFPSGLEPLFSRMLLQIKPERRQIIAQILRWVVVAARPLTVLELSIAFEKPNEDYDNDQSVQFSREEVLRDQILSCGFFLSITKDTINLIHQSAKDYLLRKISDSNAELEAFRIQEEEGNLELARRCFYYLQDVALVGEQPVNNPQTFKMKSERRQNLPKEFPLLSYAMRYWPTHAGALSHDDDIFTVSNRFYKDAKFCAIWSKMYFDFDGTIGQRIPLKLLHIASYFDLRILAENIISTYRSLISEKPSGAKDQVNELDTNGLTALHIAAQHGYVAMSQLLLNKEAHIDTRDVFKRTALHVAVKGGHLAVVRLLLDRGASIEATDVSGETPLHCATQGGFTAIVGLLLQRGASIDAKNSFQDTSIYLATRNGYSAVVGLLLDRGASTKNENSREETLLHVGARKGHSAVVELWLDRGASTEAKNSSEETPLHVAARSEHILVVELLLDRGASTEAQSSSKKTSLHLAASGKVRFHFKKHHLVEDKLRAIVRLLLDKGASIEAKDSFKETPLHCAAWDGHTAVMELLLDRGAFVEAENNDKIRPLHIATIFGHLVMVKLLLRHRADITAKDNDESTPLHFAAQRGNQEIVQLLLNEEASIEAKNRFEMTPLHNAAKRGRSTIVEVLLLYRANVNSQDCDGWTALHHAAQCRAREIVELLLDNGADIEMQCRKGKTALHQAAELGHLGIVLVLLDAGSSINAQDKSECTAVHHAAVWGHTKTLKLLLVRGASTKIRNCNGLTALQALMQSFGDKQTATIRLFEKFQNDNNANELDERDVCVSGEAASRVSDESLSSEPDDAA